VIDAFPRVSYPLPRGWTRARLDDLAHRGSGHTPSQDDPAYWDGGVKWVSLADCKRLDQGYIRETAKEISTEGIAHSSAVLHSAETVILSRDAGVGKSAILKTEMAVSQHFISWNCRDKGLLEPWYLYEWLQLNKAFFERMAVGSTIRTIGLALFRRLTIDFPPIREQCKIARILRTWDEAIDKTARVLEIKSALYLRLAEALLVTPTLAQYSKNKHSARPLSQFTNELTKRNSANALGREFVMGVSNAKGIVPMREQTIGNDLSRYKILPPKAFAYNPMRINVGSIAMSRRGSDVLVSPDYILFECKEHVLSPDYFDHLCSTHWWNHYINESGSGSVRQRIYYDDLAALRVVIPPFNKQEQIANCLNEARREIELIETQIAALNKQKRGLMQKLLTGDWKL
jgi:type I restriction enzyme S subunit